MSRFITVVSGIIIGLPGFITVISGFFIRFTGFSIPGFRIPGIPGFFVSVVSGFSISGLPGTPALILREGSCVSGFLRFFRSVSAGILLCLGIIRLRVSVRRVSGHLRILRVLRRILPAGLFTLRRLLRFRRTLRLRGILRFLRLFGYLLRGRLRLLVPRYDDGLALCFLGVVILQDPLAGIKGNARHRAKKKP